MNLKEAVATFQNIHLSNKTVEEKKLAIRTVLEMETHITKQEILNALDWLYQIMEH